MFQSKDLMASVLPGGGLHLFPETCRISANDPHGRPECKQRSTKPGAGPEPKPQKPPACRASQPPPAGDGGRERKPQPKRAAELALLRRELRVALSPFETRT